MLPIAGNHGGEGPLRVFLGLPGRCNFRAIPREVVKLPYKFLGHHPFEKLLLPQQRPNRAGKVFFVLVDSLGGTPDGGKWGEEMTEETRKPRLRFFFFCALVENHCLMNSIA